MTLTFAFIYAAEPSNNYLASCRFLCVFVGGFDDEIGQCLHLDDIVRLVFNVKLQQLDSTLE